MIMIVIQLKMMLAMMMTTMVTMVMLMMMVVNNYDNDKDNDGDVFSTFFLTINLTNYLFVVRNLSSARKQLVFLVNISFIALVLFHGNVIIPYYIIILSYATSSL